MNKIKKRLKIKNIRKRYIIKFLLKHDIYEKYLCYLSLSDWSYPMGSKDSNDHDFIFNAFNWLETKEGNTYWNEIHEKYQKYYKIFTHIRDLRRAHKIINKNIKFDY